MKKAEQLEDFYKKNSTWMPDNLKKELGHFNVFRLEEHLVPNTDCLPYSRRDFYKVSLITGPTKFYYADKSVEFEKSALIFANPQIPYSWESTAEKATGFFCIFSESFLDNLAHIKEYPVFKPGDPPVFILSDQQLEDISKIYQKMLQEINSEFTYKYDLLRNLLMELIYSALKMTPATSSRYNESTASVRVASVFTELLERQFPIESPNQKMKFRSPTEFATQLSIHVNHLNRSLKEVTGKTTSQLIEDRLIQEARALLMHSDWTITQIAWCLGFEELPHFINYFKKNVRVTPRAFRKIQNV
ncbi:helix-turn-helix transcriptional regulator [Pedobacter antarcticus]|uniref:helix-turn-helix domain-containing protein n=1 Tax=Pedobacter antarcticus TaxID=34086 RepID=UPI00292DFB94|nr:helix-turn-helix transcriptional regulator [Pedobacter antarcticus]